ncbi:hypothetical protein ACIBI4_19290 [Streptomyces sp. NPDC050418]|uniref:DUF7144 family membrane protein n=1 Tax=Streptomyces sp. NPDC050418 TaxID=3365612 RepID=UPI003789E937
MTQPTDPNAGSSADPNAGSSADPNAGTSAGPGAGKSAGTDTHPGWAAASGGPAPQPPASGAKAEWAVGGTMFAGVMMGVAGIVGALQGIAAIADDDVYTRIGDYVFSFDLTTWGWIHLLLGIVVAVVGFGILKNQDWARGAGIGIAALYVVEYFLFLPYAPVWSVIAIALGVFVIWALATDR